MYQCINFYFFLCNGFGCAGSLLLLMGCSLVEVSGGYSLSWCVGFSLRWPLLLWNMGSRVCGLQQLRFPGFRAQDW